MAHHGAVMMLASMNTRDVGEWFTGILTCGDFDADLLVDHLSRIVTRQRVAHKAEAVGSAPKPDEQFESAGTWLSRAAAAARLKNDKESLKAQCLMSSEESSGHQHQALVAARAAAVEAIRLIDVACLTCDTPVPTLAVARALMHNATLVGAGTATKMMSRVVAICEPHQRDAFKAAANAVRDVVMLKCRGYCDIFDKEGFLSMVAEAYQGELTEHEHAQILLSYQHYRTHNKKPGFLSNNSLRPRSGKKFQPGVERTLARFKTNNSRTCSVLDSTASSASAQPGSWDKNLDAAASIAPSTSACAAASPANCAITDQYSSAACAADYYCSASCVEDCYSVAWDQTTYSSWHAFAAGPQWWGVWRDHRELLEEQELAFALACSSEPTCSHTCPAQGGTTSISSVAAASSSSATAASHSAAASSASASAACSGTSAAASSSRARQFYQL